jgi:hypothetical protein
MRTPIFVLFLFSTFFLSAQQKVLELPIGWRGSGVELHTISDKAKQQSCTFIANGDSIRAFLLNNKMQLVQQFQVPRLYEVEHILGGFIKENKIYLFVENTRLDQLHNWVLDVASGTCIESKFPFDLKKEKIIDRISCGDHFLYFTINKETSEFIIYDFTSEKEFSITRHAFPEKIWTNISKPSLFRRSVDIQKIDQAGECNAQFAVCHNKLYVRNDTLLLVMNTYRGATQVYAFDLKNKNVTERVIAHPYADMNNPKAESSENSFLQGKNLYYIRATSDSLCIQILDFYSGKIVKTLAVEKEEPITFKNTPIIQEGSTMSSGSSSELRNTKQLLRKMLNGDVVIIATPNYYKQIELVAGSFTKVVALGPNNYEWVPAASSVSGKGYMPVGALGYSAWSKSARFKSVLNAETFEHVNGNAPNSINEQIRYHTAGIKSPLGAENLFMTNGRYYYVCYDQKARNLIVMKF